MAQSRMRVVMMSMTMMCWRMPMSWSPLLAVAGCEPRAERARAADYLDIDRDQLALL